jgi:hypothetical protein
MACEIGLLHIFPYSKCTTVRLSVLVTAITLTCGEGQWKINELLDGHVRHYSTLCHINVHTDGRTDGRTSTKSGHVLQYFEFHELQPTES